MILKFFKRGAGNTKSGESVENYLLDDERQEKEQALVLRGDPAQTTAIINGLDFQKTYTSGCLSFAENEGERLTAKQKYEIMDSFEEALFGDFDKDKISGYWVQHADKGRLELNFVFANVELEKGRSLTVYNHATDRKRLYAWKNITIADYDLVDPDHPDRKRDFVAKTPSNDKKKDNDLITSTGKLNATKQGIGEYVLSQAQQGKINNRGDVMAFLRDQLQVTITRETKKSITIETPHPKTGKPQKIRLEGTLYERDFTATTTDPSYRADQARNYDQQYTKRINKLRAMYHNLSKYKSEKLRERYKRDKTRADELARKRRQQNDKREREPVKQHSEQASARTSKYIRKHTEPGSANVISPGPADDPRATGINISNQADLQRSAKTDDTALQSPIITDDLYGRSGVVFGAYLPYGSVQSDVMGQIVTTANDTFDSNNTNNDDSLSIHQKQPDTGITPHDRHQPASTIDIKSIMRKLAKSATSNLEEYATAINEYIADTKNRATDSLNELATASEQQQRTIRELIKQTGTATATAKQLILEREKPQQAPQPAPSEQEKENKKGEPAQAPQPAPSEQEKENNKGKPAQAPQPAPPTHSTNRPRLR
jgi:hypothetical protein